MGHVLPHYFYSGGGGGGGNAVHDRLGREFHIAPPTLCVRMLTSAPTILTGFRRLCIGSLVVKELRIMYGCVCTVGD